MTWRRHKLAVCLRCRRTLKDDEAPHQARQIARGQLRLVQEGFARVRLARRLRRFLTGETTPFTAEEHARLFDGIHEARESAEIWRARLARLRTPRPQPKFERARP
jgi:hypothetical protein